MPKGSSSRVCLPVRHRKGDALKLEVDAKTGAFNSSPNTHVAKFDAAIPGSQPVRLPSFKPPGNMVADDGSELEYTYGIASVESSFGIELQHQSTVGFR